MIIGEYENLLQKYYDILRVDATLRKTNLNFKGFYTEIPYPVNLKKMIEIFDNIMAQMPEEPKGDDARVNLESP